jgi:hypothetical protein
LSSRIGSSTPIEKAEAGERRRRRRRRRRRTSSRRRRKRYNSNM